MILPASAGQSFRCQTLSVSIWITSDESHSILLKKSPDGRTCILQVSEETLRKSESDVVYHLAQLLEQRNLGTNHG